MIGLLKTVIALAALVWAAWMGWMLGYAAGERDAWDSDPGCSHG